MRELSRIIVTPPELVVKAKGDTRSNDYARSVRGYVHGLWAGSMSFFQYVDTMVMLIERGLRNAWYDGAAECGIQPEDLTLEELNEMHNAINTEIQYVMDYANAIYAGSKANRGKLRDLMPRAEMWVLRYADIRNRARILACGDQKLIWTYGDTQHCRSCLALHGKVKRASFWRQSGVTPQHPPNGLLECKGYRCQCTLSVTNLPISPGPLPMLP